MTLNQCKSQLAILTTKQLTKLKGGTDDSDTTNIFVIDDMDVI